MRKQIFTVILSVCLLLAPASWAHTLYVKANPTNQNGIEFGVDNATGFARWRAYVYLGLNGNPGQNTGWKSAGDGWWYYDLSTISQRVMWRLDGIANKAYTITYWVFRSDGTWDFGPKVEVISDQVIPDACFTNLQNNTVYQKSDFSVKVSSSDNLSGVSAIRIYVVTPGENCAISGWLPSGISNQYYQEFSATSVDYNFTAPCEGLYTFTLWVKDNAGNIAYEPNGPVTVGVDLPAPPPSVTAPLAPTNFKLTPSGQAVALSWSDNAFDEEGYQLYRDDSLLKTLSANAINFTDGNVVYGQTYNYKLFAFKGDLNSEAVTGTITLTAPNNSDYRYADSFMYPISCPDNRIYRLEMDSQIPSAACFDYQPLGSLFAYIAKMHQGSDFNYKGINDKGKPLYSIANALVWDFGWVNGWGNYLILRVQANPGKYFRLTDGSTVNEIFALYAHLDEIKVIKGNGETISQSNLVKKSTYLAKGWQVGTIGDAGGIYSPHLHFEIRINGYDQLGHGYWSVDDNAFLTYFVDPVEFIDNNKDAQTPPKIIIHGYDLASNRKVYLNFTTGVWQRQGRVYEGLPLASVGNSNYIWLTDSGKTTTASWDFYVPVSGAYSMYLVLPRYYGQAKGVQYEIWHSSKNLANPYKVTLDQTNNDINQVVYLGSFDYNANWKNSVAVKVAPNNYPVEKVALDTLILVYEGDLGTGGGPALPPDDGEDPVELQTIFSDGDLSFRYEGTYISPMLICYGSSLEDYNPIFDNGVKSATVSVQDSSSVFCNIQFEDGSWMGQYDGIKTGQKLYVNDIEITSALDNNQGGTNLVFNLDVQLSGGDTLVPPAEDDEIPTRKIDVHVSGDVKGLNCAMSADNGMGSWFNLVIIFIPLIMIFAFRTTQRLRSK